MKIYAKQNVPERVLRESRYYSDDEKVDNEQRMRHNIALMLASFIKDKIEIKVKKEIHTETRQSIIYVLSENDVEKIMEILQGLAQGAGSATESQHLQQVRDILFSEKML